MLCPSVAFSEGGSIFDFGTKDYTIAAMKVEITTSREAVLNRKILVTSQEHPTVEIPHGGQAEIIPDEHGFFVKRPGEKSLEGSPHYGLGQMLTIHNLDGTTTVISAPIPPKNQPK